MSCQAYCFLCGAGGESLGGEEEPMTLETPEDVAQLVGAPPTLLVFLPFFALPFASSLAYAAFASSAPPCRVLGAPLCAAQLVGASPS